MSVNNLFSHHSKLMHDVPCFMLERLIITVCLCIFYQGYSYIQQYEHLESDNAFRCGGSDVISDGCMTM